MTTSHSFDDAASMHRELRPLDPDADPLAPGRFEQSVMSRIASRDAAPFVPTDPLYGLWSLPRPLLLAASIVALAVLGVSIAQRSRTRAAPATIAESMGVPVQLLASSLPR